MIPFRHTDERIWYAQRTLLADRRDPEEYVVHVDPELWVDVRRTFSWEFPRFATSAGEWSIFGMKIAVDPRPRRGQIAVRHEVEA